MSQWPCVDEESQSMLKHSSVTFVCILVNLMNFSDAFIVCACLLVLCIHKEHKSVCVNQLCVCVCI